MNDYAPSRDLIAKRRKKKTQVFRHKYYQDQFQANEQKIINESLNILSREYSQQKTQITLEEAKFVCYYFYSVFELSRRDFAFLEKELIQLYHDVTSMQEVSSVVDIILNLKKQQPLLKVRCMGQYSDSDIAENLSHKQILQVERSWSTFDEEQDGFISSSGADQPIYHLLSSYGIDKSHPDYQRIKEFIEEWKQRTSYYLFFNEYASLVCEINAKFPLIKKNSKETCSCNIF